MVLLPGFPPGAAGAEAPLPVAPLPVLVVPEPEAEFELTAVPPQPAASSAAPRAATPVSSALRGILLEVNSVAFQSIRSVLLATAEADAEWRLQACGGYVAWRAPGP